MAGDSSLCRGHLQLWSTGHLTTGHFTMGHLTKCDFYINSRGQ